MSNPLANAGVDAGLLDDEVVRDEPLLPEEPVEGSEPNAKDLAELEAEETKLQAVMRPEDFESGAFFFREVYSRRLLEPDEVRALYVKMKNGTPLEAGAARDKMILHNMRIAVHWAKKYRERAGCSFDDLIQEGLVGLMKAVEKFDPSLGNTFYTYGHWWVRQQILKALSSSAQVRLPLHVHDKRQLIKKKAAELRHLLGRQPSITEIAAAVGCTEQKVTDTFSGVGDSSFSFDQQINTSDGDGSTHGELFIDHNQITPSDALQIKEGTQRFTKELQLLLTTLETVPDREAVIFKEYYGLTEGTVRTFNNLELVGLKFGLTRERVRQIRGNVWRTVESRCPQLKLDHDSLSDMRSDMALFEEVWGMLEPPSSGAHASNNGSNGKVKSLLPGSGKKWRAGHFRASPAYVRWRPGSAHVLTRPQLVLAFVSDAYEVPLATLCGHKKQSDESKWCRGVACYIMLSAEVATTREVASGCFVSPYNEQVDAGVALVAETIKDDEPVRQDVEGMLAHFISVACQKK